MVWTAGCVLRVSYEADIPRVKLYRTVVAQPHWLNRSNPESSNLLARIHSRLIDLLFRNLPSRP
jgi:hypothetical protein